MLAAINLNDQVFFQTDKINRIGADDMLTSEFFPCQLPVPEKIPQPLLCFGSIPAQTSGKGLAQIHCPSCQQERILGLAHE